MADNLNRRKPEDNTKISLTEQWEIDYWTQELGVTEAQLRAAVGAVGNSAAKVRAHLKGK